MCALLRTPVAPLVPVVFLVPVIPVAVVSTYLLLHKATHSFASTKKSLDVFIDDFVEVFY